MKRQIALQTVLFFLIATVSGYAMGGGGTQAPPEDDTIRISMKPVADDDLDEDAAYGWIRITPNKFAVGANRLEPNSYYAVYFVGEDDRREPATDKPVRRTFGDGEFKFEFRLEEPLGAEWDTVVLYHRPNGEEDPSDEVPVLEGSLE